MSTTEHTINDAIANLLRDTRRSWRGSRIVSSENTGMLRGSSGRPDILIIEPNVSPVVIETEVLPAISVEAEAVARLGKHLRSNGRTILSSVAVRLPIRLRDKQGTDLLSELNNATDLEMALFTGRDLSVFVRWPRSGWIQGSIADLSILAQSASVPPDIIEEAVNHLVVGVSEVAGILGELSFNHVGAIHKISEELYQEDGEQTRRMAATILANAFIFQGSLAGGPGALGDVKSVEELRNTEGELTKAAILVEWRKILKVNYWPIFDIARRVFQVIPIEGIKPIIESLAETADNLLENRLMRSHDLTGAVFQRLIADRKFLAAYYTTPASAALLVGLAMKLDAARIANAWSDIDSVQKIRIADFACGTGTLLTTAYQRLNQLHELMGGDSEKLHPHMMAEALVGCDVLPAAAHLTASMLAGAHPTVTFGGSSIMTMPYGRQPEGGVALGSLDLLNPQGTFEILAITAVAAEGMGEAEREIWKTLPHSSFDIVIMNPPFTRATGHEGKKIGVPNPMFAAFSSTKEEQRQMGAATKRLTAGTSAHGNAGEASIFLVLADRKLKAEGMLALVLPLSLMLGEAWENSRRLLARNYSDLILVSIAGSEDSQMSFSADTDMGECLVVGRKSAEGSRRATCIILNERPAYPLLGTNAAEQIHRLISKGFLRRLEEGPLGGTPLVFGDEVIGQAIDAPLPASGGWKLARIADLSLAQTAFQLADERRIWLPTISKIDSVEIPITTIENIGAIGPYHMDINGQASNGGIRGPFSITGLPNNRIPTYPVLWSHDAGRECTIAFEADSEGIPLVGTDADEQTIIEQKIAEVWATASHCHFNRDFRFNSQPTGMQFTTRRTIGGRAWLSISLSSVDEEKALVVWANTSLGLLLHWWHANKQQSGRGSIGKSSLQTLPVLAINKLSPQQINEAVRIFDDMREEILLPFHKIDNDRVRARLDEEVGVRVLGLTENLFEIGGPFELLRMKLAQEPSIRGTK